ncbi:helix-turn-helix domain-containing protein [Kitasatospora sp. NPDC006786]|uniref:helix-turn-helix domain-containing protein n=1 Tax=unclassified Kitasatospora TaxID=2633591 RepID=UPI0033C41F88
MADSAVSKAARRFVPCVPVLPRVLVPVAEQWVATTRGRVALDPYGWMQAVHWVVASGCYRPSRSHGPREMGRTAIRTAQLLMELSPCRPGVDYLARRLGVTERTAQYQLDMLREAGLLAYVAKGTRVRGEKAKASEFVRVIPAEFDVALGVRTVGESTGRRVVGIAEAGRAAMALLGKRASRKVRAARAKASAKTSVTTAQTPSSDSSSQVSQAADDTSAANSRCTPMGGGCCTTPADGCTHLPSETDVASGKPKSTAAKKSTKGRGKRTVNRVGRRYQLAAELVRQVPWLRRALVPRIAWVVQEVADAGWTAEEVVAWLSTLEEPQRGSYRPSGLLAHRLRGMTQMPGWRTPKERAAQVEHWRESRSAAQARHSRNSDEWRLTDWQDPATRAVGRLVDQAFAQVRKADGQGAQELALFAQDQNGLTDLHRLTREDVIELRTLGQRDPEMVLMAIRDCGEAYARQLYTHGLVDQVLRLRHTHRMTIHQPWRSA